MAQYYLAQNGQKAGPFSVEQLLQNGLNPNSLVFTQGMTAWTKASEVPELAAALAPAPAPAPAPAAQPQYQAPQPQYQAPQPQYQQPYQQPAMGNYVATPQMDFMTAVKTCLKKYFDFSGRARRSEFWWFYLACYVVTGILGALIKIPMAYANSAAHDVVYNGADFASANSNYHTMLIIWAVIFGIIYLGLLIPQLSAMCRRLHDVGKSGHLMWLFLVCGIGGLIPLILCIPEGRPEPNKYGESPKFVLQQ